MKNVYRLILSCVLALGLAGCFESDVISGPASGYHTYGIENITVNIPDEWETITPAQFGSNVSPNTIIAFRSNLKNPYYTANVTIIKNAVPPETLTSDFVKSLQHRIETTLVSYKAIDKSALAINVGGKALDTSLLKSEGAEVPHSDVKYFVHVAAVYNGFVYTAIGSSLLTADDAEKERLDTIVSSLVIK